jgi:hypothetical protein
LISFKKNMWDSECGPVVECLPIEREGERAKKKERERERKRERERERERKKGRKEGKREKKEIHIHLLLGQPKQCSTK